MKKMMAKSLVIQMIGVIFSGYTLYMFNPFGLAYFGALHSADIYRWPALVIMGVAMVLLQEKEMAVKSIIMMVATSLIIYLSENEDLSFTRRKKNTNPYFSAAVSAMVFTAVEMAASILEGCDLNRVIINIAAGTLVFSLSVIFAKSLEALLVPDGELVSSKKTKPPVEVVKNASRINRFARSLEKLSKSIDELAITAIPPSPDCDAGFIEGEDNSQVVRMRRLCKGRIDESRKAIAVQLKEMANMINEFSKEEYQYERLEYEREHYIRNKLKSRGIALKRIAVIKNRRNITELVITVKGTRGRIVTMKEFINILQDGMGKTLRPAGEFRRIVSCEEYTYNFTEETNFQVLYGTARAVKDEESVSGDNFAFMEMGTGRALMSLSDGMGSGIPACRDSEIVIELLEELLDCGFSEEVALRLINSVFLVNSENLSPATVDMGIIDMYSGVCDFVKLGAASTFVKRGRWVESIKSTSLPMGVFERPDVESVSKKLYNGDYVIMVSDGILDSIRAEDKERKLGEIIMNISGTKPKEMADEILNAVIKAGNNEVCDDMTVIVTGVWERCA